MAASDKIYVREYPEGLNQVWDEKLRVRTVAIAHHEYISKDALLEWAEENMDSLGRLSYGELIDKLNSI